MSKPRGEGSWFIGFLLHPENLSCSCTHDDSLLPAFSSSYPTFPQYAGDDMRNNGAYCIQGCNLRVAKHCVDNGDQLMM